MWWLSSLWQSSHLKEGRSDWQGLLGRICAAPSDIMFYEGLVLLVASQHDSNAMFWNTAQDLHWERQMEI